MYRCIGCGKYTELPKCMHCGYEFVVVNGVYQLTNDPSMNLDDGKGVKYIGYDNIGRFYGGKTWYECEPCDIAIGKKMAELTSDGILLDLACGNGLYSIPAALCGCNVIAGDISNIMVELLIEKAKRNNVDLTKITPCRMNALSIPLKSGCIDIVLANSFLHLVSDPHAVIEEIYRVLRSGGKLVLGVNSPGLPQEISDEIREINEKSNAIQSEFHRRYFAKLRERGIYPSRYSWKFDQYAECERKFGNREEIRIDFYERRVCTISDNFLYRMSGKGFSDQQSVDEKSHREVFAEVDAEIRELYGHDYAKTTYVHITDGLVLQVFTKQ